MNRINKPIKEILIGSALGLLFTLLQGCSDSQMITADTLRVDFSVLNESKLPTAEFADGANPIFHLSIKNESNEQVTLNKNFWINPDLFKVYKYETESKQFVSIGSAVNSIALTQEIGLVLQPNQTVIYEVPWAITNGTQYSGIFEINQANKSLTKGLYQTTFQLHFEATSSQTKKVALFDKDLVGKWEVK